MSRVSLAIVFPFLLGVATHAAAATEVLHDVEQRPLNLTAIAMFLVFAVATLGITYWAAARTRSMDDFYTSGGGITGFRNDMALSGDYMSAAALLGVTSMIFFHGYDGVIYAISFFVAWPLLLFLFAERIRNLCRVTIAHIASYWLDQSRIRTLTAFGSLTVVWFYLVVQMVGVGQLIQLLFGLPYNDAIMIVGLLMVASTRVQIIKAALMLCGGTLLAVLALCRIGFSPDGLFGQAVAARKNGLHILLPSKLVSDPIALLSLAIGLVFGTAGLPHILMRFFTAPDAKEARKSVFVATEFIGFFYLVIMVLGTAAIAIVGRNPSFYVGGMTGGKLVGGSNLPVIHLAQALGGNLLLGFLLADAFATILAVVSGLTMAGTSAISRDLYVMVPKMNRADPASERRVSRIASVCIGVVAVLLGIVFKDQNIAFLVALIFGVAASVSFPILALSMYWKRLTTRGALTGGHRGPRARPHARDSVARHLGHGAGPCKFDRPIRLSSHRFRDHRLPVRLAGLHHRTQLRARERDDLDEPAIRAQTGHLASGAVGH